MTTHSTPSWYRVLRCWIDKHEGHGLSFSILVGATRTPIGMGFKDEREAKKYSRALYDELTRKRSVEGFVVHIHDCDIVDGSVVTLEYGVKPGSYKMPPFDELWASYGADITAGKFSRTQKRSHAMTEDEKKWVSKALEE